MFNKKILVLNKLFIYCTKKYENPVKHRDPYRKCLKNTYASISAVSIK